MSLQIIKIINYTLSLLLIVLLVFLSNVNQINSEVAGSLVSLREEIAALELELKKQENTLVSASQTVSNNGLYKLETTISFWDLLFNSKKQLAHKVNSSSSMFSEGADFYKPTISDAVWSLVIEKDEALKYVEEMSLYVVLSPEQREKLLKQYKSPPFYSSTDKSYAQEKESFAKELLGETRYSEYLKEKNELNAANKSSEHEEMKIVLKRRFNLSTEQVQVVESALKDIASSIYDYSKGEPTIKYDDENMRDHLESRLGGSLSEEQITLLAKCIKNSRVTACTTWHWWKSKTSSIDYSYAD